MDSEIKRKIDNCFDWNNDPADSFGAPALMEQENYWDDIDLNDDDDIEDLMELAMRSMRMGDKPNADFVKYLISRGFDVNAKIPGRKCLILEGADYRLDPSVMQQLIDLGADIYSENSAGDNALLLAARRSYSARDEERDGALAIYIAEHFDLSILDKTDRFGITPLMYAALENHIILARTLIRRGSDVNSAGTQPIGGNSYWLKMDGVTPLALACRCGRTEIAKMLLEAGADETLCDTKGNPPIFSLLRYPFNFFNNSCYNDPIFKRKCEILSMLKETELTDSKGYTVFMRSMCDSEDHFDKASGYNNLPITLALLEKGVNIEAVANDGKRPIHLAVLSLGDVYKNLVKAGAELNVQDNEGNTPLLIALENGKEKAARYLIKSGADYTVQNSSGDTAMSLAAAKGFSDVMELMMDN